MTRSASPSLAPDEIARFSSQASQFWDARGPFRMLHALTPVRMRYVVDQIGADRMAGCAVLDVGAGGGLLAEGMAALGAQVVGLDPSAQAVDTARAHAKKAGLVIDYRQGSAEDLARTGAKFDVITAMEVVEHVADLDSFLGALSQMLRPGGLLIVSSLNRTKRSFVLGVVAAEYVLGWVAAGTHQWARFRRPSELVAALAPLKIEPQDLTGLVFSPFKGAFVLDKRNMAVNYFLTARKAGPAQKSRGRN